MKYGGAGFQVAGYWDPGCWDSGHWVLGSGHWVLGCWKAVGYRLLTVGGFHALETRGSSLIRSNGCYFLGDKLS